MASSWNTSANPSGFDRVFWVQLQSEEPSDDRIHVVEHGDVLQVAVFDGAGGVAGASVAADLAMSAVQSARLTSAEQCRSLLRTIDAVIAGDRQAGECAGVVVVMRPDRTMGASAGDCQAWRIGAENDELTHRQDRRRLGSGRAVPETFDVPWRSEHLLVGSDGLFDYHPLSSIAQGLRDKPLAEAASDLAERLQLPSGPADDYAFVIARSSDDG